MSRLAATQRLDRVSTGNASLDTILGGGLPAGSVTVLAGSPGSGKTVLALQMTFDLARAGKRIVYFTTLSEPALKLVQYMQLFSFFDETLLDSRVSFIDVGSELREQGRTAALARVKDRIEQLEPDLVVIDSFKAIHDFETDTPTRSFVYDLSVHAAGWGANTLLVGEYSTDDMKRFPEFSIADSIIHLTAEYQDLVLVRGLEIRKLRGSHYVTGRHFFDIDSSGFLFYPRVRVPEGLEPGDEPETRPVSTGVAGLDELLSGGLPTGSATLIQGGTGAGKTILSVGFLVDGANRGEPGVLFTLEETPSQIRRTAAGFGWNLRDLEARKLLRIRYASPVELSTDRFLHQMREEVASLRALRVVLDSVTALSLGVASERRFRELVYVLCKCMRHDGVTFVTTMEIPELLGTTQLTGHGVSSITDNAVLLRYVEVGGRLERAVSVLKARGVPHSTELRRLVIDGSGPSVDRGFTELRGVLTGIPVPARELDT